MAELRAFHATALAGTMSAAARRLRLTQPTVSAHVARLEQRCRAELFLRRGRRVELTELGRSLLDITQRLFEAEHEAQSLLLEAAGEISGQLRISAVGPYNVTPMLAAFRRQHPRVRLAVDFGDSRQIVERVLGYRADIGVLVHAVSDARIHCLPYRRQRLIVFAHRAHRLARAGRSAIRLAELEGEEFVAREHGSTTRRVFDAALHAAGIGIRVALEIGSRESIREAVAAGLGLGVVSEPAFVPDPRLVPLAIADADIATHSHVICMRERRHARPVAAFLEIAERLREGRAPGATSPGV